MSAETARELATLATDPERIDDLDRARVPALLGSLEALRARLWGRMMEPPTPTTNGTRPVSDVERAAGDVLLDADEAAERMGLTRKQLYRRADALPFTRRIGERTLRFSRNGMEEWLASQ